MATWVTPTHDAARYTANGAMTWTVGAGDVTTFKYRLTDTTMLVSVNLASTTVAGTPNSTLYITLPEGRTAAKTMIVPIILIDNGTLRKGLFTVTAADTRIAITRLDGVNFAAAADATGVFGEILLEVS